MKIAEGPGRVASAYVTDKDLLSGIENRSVQVLTYLSSMDIISGATSLDSLRFLIEMGAACRCLRDGPRLHAKVYIFGEQFAVVTSANLTNSALDKNIEVGVQLKGSAVEELAVWFDAFWAKAQPLDVAQVAKWQQETAALRHAYGELRRKAASALPSLPNEALTADQSPEELGDLLGHASRFFCCNTNRREGGRTPDGVYDLEGKMHSSGYAAAWESFDFRSHMDRVEPGDAIFMFAKGVGIVGIGRAKAKRQTLEPGDPDRIRKEDNREWRVPVDWLAWRSDKDAYRLKGQNSTFWEVTGKADLREAVRRHFLG